MVPSLLLLHLLVANSELLPVINYITFEHSTPSDSFPLVVSPGSGIDGT